MSTSTVVVRSAYTPKPRVQLYFDEDSSLTQQHFRDEADVNNIMARYGASRVLEHYSQFQGNYGDFTDVQDYHTSCNEVIKAQEMFMSLPSSLRARFSNDPAEFLAFVGDESNRDEMQKLGLLHESSTPLPDTGNPVVTPEDAPE